MVQFIKSLPLNSLILIGLMKAAAAAVYIGCFDTWLSAKWNQSYELYIKGESPEICVDLCELDNGTYHIALVRSWFCFCTVLNRREVGLSDLIRVAESNCDLERNSKCYNLSDSRCGGTFAYSAYANQPLNLPEDYEPIYEKDLKDLKPIYHQPEIKCAKCNVENCLPTRRWARVNKLRISQNIINDYQYGFMNSPLNCINFCRRYINVTKASGKEWNGENYAVLGFNYVVQTSELDYSFCYCLAPGKLGDFSPIPATKCSLPCPGDENESCGGGSNNVTKYQQYTIYKIPDEPITTPKGNMLQLSFHQTIYTGSSKQCSAYDAYNQLWEGKPDEVVLKSCPTGYPSGANASWTCLSSGTFEGSSPSYKTCENKWVQDTLDELENATMEDVGNILEAVEKQTDDAKNPSNVESQYFGHEIVKILDIIRTGIDGLNEDKCAEPIVKCGIRIVDNMLTHSETWKQLNLMDRMLAANDSLQTMEHVLAQLFFQSNTSKLTDCDPLFLFEANAVKVASGLINKTYDGPISFPAGCDTSMNCILVPLEFTNKSFGHVVFSAMQIDSAYIQDKLPGHINTLKDPAEKDKILMGPLMTFSFHNRLSDTEFSTELSDLHDKPIVSISIMHAVPTSGPKTTHTVRRKLHPGESRKASLESATCVYWNEASSFWSTDGCKLVEISRTRSVCHCNHLTYFSVLVSLHNYEENEKGLEYLTIGLSSISVLTLFVSCISYFTNIDTKKHAVITQQLSILLILGNISMLMFVDRAYFIRSDELCTTVAIGTEYIFLAAFMFMGAEGWMVYKSVISIKHPHELNTTKLSILAYITPLVVISATVLTSWLTSDGGNNALHVYGGERACWLEGYYIWSFLILVAIILTGNFITIGMVVRAARKSQAKIPGRHIHQSRLRLRIRGILSLSVILGLSWFVGFFVLIPNSTASIGMAYAFTVLNASQGIFVAVFHCFLEEKKLEKLKQQVFPNWFKSWSPNQSQPIIRNRFNVPKFNVFRRGNAVRKSQFSEKSKIMKSN